MSISPTSNPVCWIDARQVSERIERLVPDDPRQLRLWQACELALQVEVRSGIQLDPTFPDAAVVLQDHAGILAPGESLSTPGQPGAVLCWLMHGTERAGIIGLDEPLGSRHWLRVRSLYLRPSYRGLGLGTEIMNDLMRSLSSVGARGVSLEVDWLNQAALRWYLRQRFWAWGWKRMITLFPEPDLPACRLDVRGNLARLFIRSDDTEAEVEVLSARRAGDRLQVLAETRRGSEAALPERWRVEAYTTLAVHLALHGWPLIRSGCEATEHHGSDCYHPEGLAHQIMAWESSARNAGFLVQTPIIPIASAKPG